MRGCTITEAMDSKLHRPAEYSTPRDCFVVFVDILGVGATLHDRMSNAAFNAAFKKIYNVLCKFGVPAVSAIGGPVLADRTALAISDAIVIAADLTELNDSRLALELLHLSWCQRELVAQGILLRGGIAVGKFLFKDPVLVSPALASAYRLERDVARVPRIVASRATLKRLAQLQVRAVVDILPYFVFMTDPATGAREEFATFDYLRASIELGHGVNWFADKPETQFTIRSRVRSECRSTTSSALIKHRAGIDKAMRRVVSPSVLKKYQWLMSYHDTTSDVLLDESVASACKVRQTSYRLLSRRLASGAKNEQSATRAVSSCPTT
jgi:hypothetical protein